MPPPINPPPSPQAHRAFDNWNSSSTGHQRAENPYSATTAWKETRSQKLALQFRTGECLPGEKTKPLAFDGTCGSRSPSPGANAQDSVAGPGSGSRAEWKWVSDEEARRSALGVRDIRSFMGVGKRKAGGLLEGAEKKARARGGEAASTSTPTPTSTSMSASTSTSTSAYTPPDTTATAAPDTNPSITSPKLKPRPVFAGTTVYVNGSTLPQISDHKLKHLLVAHGAQVSISMARKTVSHVVVGQPNVSSSGHDNGSGSTAGAGGGLAARKLQQEITRGGWKGVKIVGVDWVLESIRAGRRLAESRFGVVSVAGKGQGSVADMFRRS